MKKLFLAGIAAFPSLALASSISILQSSFFKRSNDSPPTGVWIVHNKTVHEKFDIAGVLVFHCTALLSKAIAQTLRHGKLASLVVGLVMPTAQIKIVSG